jgi:hypothetical protein
MSLSVGEISFIATAISHQDPFSMPLVIIPVPFILVEVIIFGINHLALAFSLSVYYLAGVETSFFVLLYSVIHYTVALILSVLHFLLVICLITTSIKDLKSFYPS